ncbi:MAG: amidohydrolase family protein [Gemmatimonadota bacterium]|nr:amidohydrolase family protein [Gemmatimonadota bacterium]
MPVPLSRAAALLAVVAVCAPTLAAQRNAPSTYAITNAKLVPVSAPVIARGTIVVRDGLIAALGANVAVPADARVIDGTGLTVYPGLFDAFGSIGIPSAAPAGGGGRGGGGGAAAALAALAAPTSTGNRSGNGSTVDQPRGVEPELSAVDRIRLDEDALDGPRSAGIATALTVSSAGIFQGQSALINLAGSNASAMIVKPNVAQHIAFSVGRGFGGGYPGSLMGVFAVLRQELIDAQRYRELRTAYAKNPRNMQRVEFDPSLEALLPALAGQQPVVMVANSQREIERALDLAKEFGLKVIIAGGSEAYLMTTRLKAENVPVLLSINFPRRTVAPAADAEPEELRVLRERVEAPKTAGRLAAAGVKFAFESGGLTTWSDFDTNVQRAVEGGLAPDQAIKALTWTPAELFGVSDRLGSLEVGKIANLTVTKGDLTDKAARINSLYVDGRPIALHPPTPAGGAGGFGGRGAGAAPVATPTPPPTPPASSHHDDNNPTKTPPPSSHHDDNNPGMHE